MKIWTKLGEQQSRLGEREWMKFLAAGIERHRGHPKYLLTLVLVKSKAGTYNTDANGDVYSPIGVLGLLLALCKTENRGTDAEYM